jgi:BMFP domain-containing protein YqiC
MNEEQLDFDCQQVIRLRGRNETEIADAKLAQLQEAREGTQQNRTS